MDLYEMAMRDFEEMGIEPTPEDLEQLEDLKRMDEARRGDEISSRFAYLKLPARHSAMIRNEKPERMLEDLRKAIRKSYVIVLHGECAEYQAVQLAAHFCREAKHYVSFVYARDVRQEFSKGVGFGDQVFRERLSAQYLFMQVLYPDCLNFSEIDYLLQKRWDDLKPTFLITDDRSKIESHISVHVSWVEVKK